MKVLYFDMDGVLVDFKSGIDQLTPEEKFQYDGRMDAVPHIFRKMKPLEGAIEAVNVLSRYFDCYILSTSPWENPTAASDKQNWIKKYFPIIFYKRMILSHRKDLLKGDYLIDDRANNGAKDFEGEWIHFGSSRYPNWKKTAQYILGKEKIRTDSFDMNIFFYRIMDFMEENDDYASLFNNYLDSSIYNEIRSFLDISHPEWRKNKNLGEWAPEFIIQIINTWEDLEEEMSTKEWLAEMYSDISSEYNSFCGSYQRYRNMYNQISKAFEQQCGTIRDFDSIEEWEKAYDDFKQKDDEEEYWVF
ncbi:MAG: hypothetical protein RQ761_11610 [Bacteroidales bacterium]|nr:hypothetical protein [Bacteroidales bacterium]